MGTASDRDDDSEMSQHGSPHHKNHECDRDGSAICREIHTGIYHSTSSMSDILNALNWDSLQLRARAKTIMLHRIYFGILFLACLSVTRSVAFYYF